LGCLLLTACDNERVDSHQNVAPVITSADTVVAMEDIAFVYHVTFEDDDGPDTIVTYLEYPDWLTHDADSLFGLPGDTVTDSHISVAVSDGSLADTANVLLRIVAVNDPPQITSPARVAATGGIAFSYVPSASDPDGPGLVTSFPVRPSWLITGADSVYGEPPDGIPDTSFVVVVSDGFAADTLLVRIDMVPCLAVYGDTRTGHTPHNQIVQQIRAVHPAAVFHTGDLVNDGTQAEDWATFGDITEPLIAESEYYPSLGNHEQQSQLYFDHFELPGNEQWYAVERNRIHFVVLNSCVALGIGSEQYLWLEQDLSSIADPILFVAAVFHHPPYSTGPHVEDEKHLRESIVPLFRQYGVDIVFNGHDHHYERSVSDGIHYIIAGGGGAPLRDQARTSPNSLVYLKTYHFCKLSSDGNRLIVRAIGIDGQPIDSFILTSQR
ncbi:MAG: metallophosphoesterase, partial [candidate division Zixibacteria bacterium]|nr:metallophosphoesterase [candidate division Zixibacteria bacterium]